jgi:HK97 family phage portal protein
MTENQQKEIQRLWFKKYGTPMNAGKPMVTNGDVDVKQLNFSPRDMQYVMGRTEVRREVCAVFGVPNSLVDINDANRASAQSGLDYYKQTTVLPKLQKFLEKLNEQLVEDYDENLFVWFDGDMIISSDEKEAAEIDRIYLDEGIYGPTYVRNRLGICTEQPDALRALPTAMRMTSTSRDPGVTEEVDNNTNINQE